MLNLKQQVWCDAFDNWLPVTAEANATSTLAMDALELPEHLRANTHLSQAVKSVEIYKTTPDYRSAIESWEDPKDLIENFVMLWWTLSNEQAEIFMDYADILKSRIFGDPDVNRYWQQLSELVDAWIMHDYVFVWEGGYGKVILVFDYSKTPTEANIIKLWKNSKQRSWWVWNLIDEAKGQQSFHSFYEWFDQSNSTSTVVKVPQVYTSDSWKKLASSPEAGYLTMEYCHGETLENLLFIAQHKDIFWDLRHILEDEADNDPYISGTLIPKFESLGVDYTRATRETLMRLLVKKDILYILELVWISVSPKANKVAFTQKKLKEALTVFFEMNNSWISNPEALSSEAYKQYEHFLKSAKAKWLEHKDLNTSNIMIDYRDWKVVIWIIDFGTTDDIHISS